MATLTETAYYARKYIRLGVFGFFVFIILRIIAGMAWNYIVARIPPAPLKPNYAFGKLPAIKFPQTASPSGQLTLRLQTIEGRVPEASEAARVFFMPKNRANLLALSQAQALVGKVGFSTTPQQLTNTLYRWVDLKNPLRTVEFDIITGHFTLKYLYPHDLQIFLEREVPSPDAARDTALQFLQSLNFTLPDLNSTKPKVQYLKLVGNQLEPTTSQSQADSVRVDFFRKDYDGMKLFTDKPTDGEITFIFSGSRDADRQILLAKYQYWAIDTKSYGIYKLKTSEQAWQELLDGKGYYASFPSTQTVVPITNVYLAYYDSSLDQPYLQPIFVFEGEGNFLAFIPAIAPPWTE
jgi:hypothetical protein